MSFNINDTISVQANKISKLYRLNAYQGSLRDAFAKLTSNFSRGRQPDTKTQVLWALKDVSFQLQRGESLGIVGPNGAGKTTTLKILSRVTRPYSGNVMINGRTAALIELAAGFHPDLTGRENIFLNGSILGMTRREIRNKFDAIVDFSGLERFLDTPVKRYSSGMYVRLAFSVAVHINPDVLLVDEVLAVGDAEFRQKCISKISDLRRDGVSIIFVSHNLFQVRAACDQGIFLLEGQIHTLGSVDEAINAYETWMRNRSVVLNEEGINGIDVVNGEDSRILKLLCVQILDESKIIKNEFNSKDSVEIRIYFIARQRFSSPHIDVRIIRADGIVCALIRSADLGFELADLVEKGYISVGLNELQLMTGTYWVDARIRDCTDAVTIAQAQSNMFQVNGQGSIGDVVSAVFLPNLTKVGTEILSSTPETTPFAEMRFK